MDIFNYTLFLLEHILPKNVTELYQICYISGENELHGASSPFQFTMDVFKKNTSPYEIMMKSSMIESKTSSKMSAKVNEKRDKELEVLRDKELDDLREENSLLKLAIKALSLQKNEGKDYDNDISELRAVTESLKTAMTQQQQEMNVLKMKIKECGEEYKKLYLEKLKLEKKVQKEKTEKTIKEKNRSYPLENGFDITNLPSIPPFPEHK